MKPYWSDGKRMIFHGDCRAVLPHIGGADLLLTDPPYGISYQTNRRSRFSKLRHAIVDDHDGAVAAEGVDGAMEILRSDRHWYVFASPRRIADVIEDLPPLKHVLCWDKGDRGTVGDLKCGFGEAWEAIVYGMKGRRELRGKRPRTVIRFDWSGAMDPVHPTVKPVGLLQQLILWSTDEDEVVLDPFAGSGTTLRAAKDLRRRAIGIEVEERYCEVAAKRLEQEEFDFGPPVEAGGETP